MKQNSKIVETVGRVVVLTLSLSVATPAFAVEHVPPEYDARIFRVSPADVRPLEKARAFVRALKAQHGGRLPRGGVIVEFADGTYGVDGTWTLTDEDSGSPECPILYRAAHPGKAVFTGETKLDWKRLPEVGDLPASAALLPSAVRARVLTAELPAGELPTFFGASCYLQDEQLERSDYQFPFALYQGDRRLPNARWPNAACATVTELTGNVQTSWIYRTSRSVTFGATGPEGAKPAFATWLKEPDLYLHGEWNHEYVDTSARPEKIDAEKGLITLERRDAQYGLKLGAPFFAFNAVSELDAEGEWALDYKARRVYALPFAAGGEPVLARTHTLLSLEGVTDVEFEGFVFERVRGHAVICRNCRDVQFRTAVVRQTTGWGIRIEGGRNCRVEGCDLHDLGEGGVWLEGGNRDTLTHSGHVCDNCHIRDYARLVWNYNPGVSLLGCGSEATHNLIHDAPHQACFFYGAEHRFAWNVVHDVCRFTNDAGAIYSYNTHDAWSHRGNVIEYNVFHRIAPPRPEYCQLNAIYLDAFTSGTIVRGNIASESTYGVFSSGGQDNRIERNVIVNTRNEAVRRWNLGLMGGERPFWHRIWGKTNDSTRASYLMKPLLDKGGLYGMSFWKDRYPNQLRPLDFTNTVLGHSSHYCRIANNVLAGSAPVHLVDPEVTEGTTVVKDNVSFVGDPGFVDFENFDWELREDSPARKTLGGGTRFGEMGLFASAKRISPAVKWGPNVTRPKKFNPYASAAVRKGVRYEDTFRSRFWMWGHHARAFRGTPTSKFLGGDHIDMPGACAAMGIPNVCVIRFQALPKKPFGDYCETLSGLDGFGWSVGDNDRGYTFAQKVEDAIDLCNMYPKLNSIWLDDWLNSASIRRPVSELVALKARLAKTFRKPKLSVVFYSTEFDLDPKPVFDVCDQISFWVWEAKDIPQMEARFRRCRELAGPEKPILLGLYMWNFAQESPMPPELMRRQLDFAGRMMKSGEVSGLIFHCTPLVDCDLEAVRMAKAWISLHGEDIWGIE